MAESLARQDDFIKGAVWVGEICANQVRAAAKKYIIIQNEPDANLNAFHTVCNVARKVAATKWYLKHGYKIARSRYI